MRSFPGKRANCPSPPGSAKDFLHRVRGDELQDEVQARKIRAAVFGISDQTRIRIRKTMAFQMKKRLAGTERRRQISSEDDADVLLTRAWRRSRRPLRRRGVSACASAWREEGDGGRGGTGFSWRLLFVLQLSSRIRGTSGNTFRRTPRPTTIRLRRSRSLDGGGKKTLLVTLGILC